VPYIDLQELHQSALTLLFVTAWWLVFLDWCAKGI